MSAYIVSMETISAIVEAFQIYNTKYHAPDYKPQTGWMISLNKERQDIGQSLLNQNYASVNYRYGEDTEPEKFVFVDVKVNPAIIYGCIRNYNYQACETDDYFDSEVYKSLEDLKENMLERIIKNQYGEIPYGYPEPEIEEESDESITIQEEPQEEGEQITLF